MRIFVDTANITGSWNAATGTLTLTGTDTLANYQAALRNVSFENTSDDPNNSTRTVSFKLNDGDTDGNTVTRDINITAVDDAPQLANIEAGALGYTEGDGAVADEARRRLVAGGEQRQHFVGDVPIRDRLAVIVPSLQHQREHVGAAAEVRIAARISDQRVDDVVVSLPVTLEPSTRTPSA